MRHCAGSQLPESYPQSHAPPIALHSQEEGFPPTHQAAVCGSLENAQNGAAASAQVRLHSTSAHPSTLRLILSVSTAWVYTALCCGGRLCGLFCMFLVSTRQAIPCWATASCTFGMFCSAAHLAQAWVRGNATIIRITMGGKGGGGAKQQLQLRSWHAWVESNGKSHHCKRLIRSTTPS